MFKKFSLCFSLLFTLVLIGENSLYNYKDVRFSKAGWLWAGTADKVPQKACLRRVIEVNEPVKNAWFYAYWDKGGTFYLNGRKLGLTTWKKLPRSFGHVRGRGADLTKLLKPGKNVLAAELFSYKVGCYGLMLRGEVELASGKKIYLHSSADEFKASPVPEKDWLLPGFDDSKWPAARDQGDVTMKPWITYGNVPLLYSSKKEYADYLKFMTSGLPTALLAKEKAPFKAKIVYRNHIPGIEINGKVYPPVVIPVYNSYSGARDALSALADRAGAKIFLLPLNIMERSADYRLQIDLSIRRLLSIVPDAYVIFSFREVASPAWLKKNPDELAGFAGKSKDKRYTSFHATPDAPSLASEKFKKLMDESIADFSRFCLNAPWGKRILGLKNSHGPSGDGMPAGAHQMPDTGKRMTEKFRAFLKDKYKTDAALQRSWGDDQVTLASARVPDAAERWGSGMYLRDPGNVKDRRVLDYYTCYHRVFNDYILSLMRSIKKHFPGRLAGCFSGYIILSYTPEGSTAAFERLLKSPDVDFMWATTRGYNLSDGQHRHLHSVFHRYGKLSSIEADIRTHIDSRGSVSWKCKSPEETRATMSKVVSNSLFYGSGYHLNGFGWSSILVLPEIIEPLATGIREWQRLFNTPPAKGADIAVVLDHDQIWKQGHPSYGKTIPMTDALTTFPLQSLNFSGFAYDLLSYKDFLDAPNKYRCVIFLNAFEVPPALRKALHKKIRQKGVTAVWHYAPGLLTPGGISDRSMQELTGIELRSDCRVQSFRAVTKAGKQMAPIGYNIKESPRISSVDKKAEILGIYTDKTAAFVRKKLADGSVAVFSGVPINHADIWNTLLTQAGCHRYTKAGFMVKTNADGLLQVFSIADGRIAPESRLQGTQVDRSGKVTVTVRGKAKQMRDVFTGEVFKVTDGRITLKNRNNRPQCWLFRAE